MKLKKKPEYGDTRIIKKFAFFPTKIDDEDYRIFFEFYYAKQKFKPIVKTIQFENGYYYKKNAWETIFKFKV